MAGFFIMTLEKSLYCPETNNSFFVPNTVVYAGGSSRRAAFLRHCFPRQDLEVVPIGDEPEIPDVLKIAEYKLHEGLSKRSLVYGEIT